MNLSKLNGNNFIVGSLARAIFISANGTHHTQVDLANQLICIFEVANI
jgi:hypothetical protein